MKVFISADIEGCAGTTLVQETHKGEAVYAKFAEQMTREVVAACEGAHAAGASEIVVKDAHGDGTNIDIMAMPSYVTLIRGKSGHPMNMMFGLDESFDAVMYVGYHSGAGSPGNPISHTNTGASNYIMLNGRYASEFVLNSYTAFMFSVPVVFLSGDDALCREAEAFIPGITTAATKVCVGGSTANVAADRILDVIRDGARRAVSGEMGRCVLPLPESFEEVINFRDVKMAYRMSFYPQMERVDDRSIRLLTDDYMDILTANSFVLY